jgi:hypothetical protein
VCYLSVTFMKTCRSLGRSAQKYIRPHNDDIILNIRPNETNVLQLWSIKSRILLKRQSPVDDSCIY